MTPDQADALIAAVEKIHFAISVVGTLVPMLLVLILIRMDRGVEGEP